MVKMREHTESLGQSGAALRHGAPTYDAPPEQTALEAANDACRVVVLLYRAPDLTYAEEAELGDLLDSLYRKWQAIGVWKPGDARVPVVGEPGNARVEWEAGE